MWRRGFGRRRGGGYCRGFLFWLLGVFAGEAAAVGFAALLGLCQGVHYLECGCWLESGVGSEGEQAFEHRSP